MAGISDEKLYDIAEDIGDHENLPRLGSALGFRQGQIQGYVKTNSSGGGVSCKGTRNMLLAWKMKTPRKEQIAKLKQVLVEQGFQDLVDDHFPEEDDAGQSAVPSQASSQSSSTRVNGKQLLTLSKILSPQKFMEMGIQLEIWHPELEVIQQKNQMNMQDAILEMLHKWLNKTGGPRATLEQALRDVDCEGLITQF
ncbi:uncharacterized protein [Diadema antillarum]|uniref:uncharacterized protein n=1 Tax=Diadema antillarum TaxID=105358 RepID=UPI003A891A96